MCVCVCVTRRITLYLLFYDVFLQVIRHVCFEAELQIFPLLLSINLY